MRYQKVVNKNGVETARYNYVYADGQLILLSYTANGTTQNAKFIYDSTGEVLGFIVDGATQYLYVKNLQGDIVAIVNESGVPVVRYIYDAWGNVTISADSGYENLTNLSPFAYRGYCYDNDIKMYYLQSRYYDPQICRFINADSSEYLGVSGGLISYNLMAYCENDPVNCVDATGTWGKDVHKGYYTDKKNKIDVKTHRFTIINDNDFIFSGRWNLHIPYVNIKATKNQNKYYGTYYWAVICGILAENAKKIADACYLVDSEYSPANPNYQNWHFDTNPSSTIDSRRVISNIQKRKAKGKLEKALKEKDKSKKQEFIDEGLMYMGFALHPLQDIWAHTPDRCFTIKHSVTIYNNYGTPIGNEIVDTGIWSHIVPLDITDNVWKRGDKINKTEQETKKFLKEFISRYGSLLK